MIKKVFLFLFPLFMLMGCQGLSEHIGNIQNSLGIHSNIKEFQGVKFEAKSCELSKARTVTCRLVITSRHQDRTLNLHGGGGYTKIQDDTGKSYATRMSFGESAEGAQRQSVLIADTPYNATLTVENISSRATKVRAINILRMDIMNQTGGFIAYVKLSLNNPPMAPINTSTSAPTSAVTAKGTAAQIAKRSSSPVVREFRGLKFEVKSCEINKSRAATCRLIVTSKLQDRTLNLLGGGYTKIQDDTGKSYSTRISFGENVEDKQITSVLIADSPYNVTLIAENISSRATKVRAIDIQRMDFTNTSGGLGAYVKLVLAHPPMIEAQDENESVTSNTNANKFAPVITPPAATKPASARANVSAKATLIGCWKWSNGAYIVIKTNGTAHNGPIGATWKTVNDNKGRYSISWPSIVDTLTLSSSGNALSGKNNIGFPISATRKSGAATSVVGNWLWVNGVTVNFRANSSVSGGPFKGTWRKIDNNWVIEWPVIDIVSVAANGRSLSVKNQFGMATAKRDTPCKAG